MPPDLELRSALAAEAEAEGAATLHARLAAIDPPAAAAIDARNLRRVIRALEVIHHSGRPFSEQARRRGAPYPWLIVALGRPRDILYARIDARVDDMVAAGLEGEVRGLVAAGLGWDLPAMQSVGYQEWAAYFGGEIDREEVLRLIRHNTRRLVRSQDSWLRSLDQPVLTLDLGDRDVGSAEVTRVMAALGAEGDGGTG